MNPPSYNPIRALQHFVALRSASRRILALEFPARQPAPRPACPADPVPACRAQ